MLKGTTCVKNFNKRILFDTKEAFSNSKFGRIFTFLLLLLDNLYIKNKVHLELSFDSKG